MPGAVGAVDPFMRVSSTASTWVQPCCWRASSATASRVSTGSTGVPWPLRAPNARPCATAQTVRSPVKEPGPRPKTMASSVSKPSPASASSRWMAGINAADACAPRRPCAATPHRRATAMERVSVLVSKAKQVHGPRVHGRAALLARGWAEMPKGQLSVVAVMGRAAGQRWCRAPCFFMERGQRFPRLSGMWNFSVSGFLPPSRPLGSLRNGGLPVIPPLRVRAWVGSVGWPWGCAG